MSRREDARAGIVAIVSVALFVTGNTWAGLIGSALLIAFIVITVPTRNK